MSKHNRGNFNRNQNQQPRQQAADVFEEPDNKLTSSGNEQPVIATTDFKVVRVDNYVAYNEAGEAIGSVGNKGLPGPLGVISDEPFEDEREGETHPEQEQDHEPEQTHNAEGEDFGDLSGDSNLSRAEMENRIGQPLDEVFTREEVKVIDTLELTTTLSSPPEPVEVKEEPTFPFVPVETWTKEQLELYISRPENMDIYHKKLLQAIVIHRQLCDTLDQAWSTDECTTFFKEQVVPKKTSKGCYVSDVTRGQRRESSWSTQELESWALGEIQPEGVVTTNGLAIELHERFNMVIKTVDVESVLAHYKYTYGPRSAQVKTVGEIPVVKPQVTEAPIVTESKPKIKYAGLTEMSQTYIEEQLKQYCDTVRPNRVVPEKVGFEAQRQLDTLFHYILKQEDPVAVKSGLDILVNTIVEERLNNPRGVFTDTNAFRFAEGVNVLNRAQEIHRRMFTLFFAFIDGDEGILAQTDVPELVKYLPVQHQNLLLGYFGRN